MRWEKQITRMRESRCVYSVLVGKHEGKGPLGRTRRRRGIILRWIFRKWDVGAWTASIWLRTGVGGRNL